MALSKLTAGNPAGVDTSVRFASTTAPSTYTVDGLVRGSSTMVQFTVNLDPTSFQCALSADQSTVVISMIGTSRTPRPVIYTVDTGINLATMRAGNTALVEQVVPQGGSNGTTYTFTKSTGGGDMA